VEDALAKFARSYLALTREVRQLGQADSESGNLTFEQFSKGVDGQFLLHVPPRVSRQGRPDSMAGAGEL